MLTNDELKKKISQIISEYCCPYGKTHKQLYGDDRMCYSKMNFAECNPITECTDALIAAKIGYVKDLQAQANALEMTNIALQAGYDDAEKDRLYWVDKYKEAEHRAQVAEKAFSNCIENFVKFQYEQKSIQLDNVFLDEVIKKCLQQAEKELAEEGKE